MKSLDLFIKVGLRRSLGNKKKRPEFRTLFVYLLNRLFLDDNIKF